MILIHGLTDTNRFNSILLNFGDAETNGDEVGLAIGVTSSVPGDIEDIMRSGMISFQ
jgi:hypothetical protein